MTKTSGTKALFYQILQFTVFAVSLPFQYASWALTQLHPGFIAHRIMRGPYYWACVQRRRALGEDEWQEHDMQLNIPPPKGHPYWQLLKNQGVFPPEDLEKNDEQTS